MKKSRVFLALAACYVVVLIAAYANHFDNSFHFDDSHTIEDNLAIRDPANVPRFFVDNTATSSLPANQGYRPVTTTSIAIDYWLGGGLDSTFFFHLSTFVWYLVLLGLTYCLYVGIFSNALSGDGNRLLALLAAAFFGIHAANAETINYVVQRAEVFSTLGAVAGLVMFARGGASRRFYVYLVPVILGVLAKESAAMFAPLLFVYVVLFERGASFGQLLDHRKLWSALKPVLVPSLVTGATLAFVSSMVDLQPWNLYGSSRWLYLLTQPFVMLHYALMFVFPYGLSADTDQGLVGGLLDDRVLIGGFFVLAMVTIAWRCSAKKETRPIAFGLVWFFLALAPSSSLIPLAEVMNDHRMFFPFVGLTLATAGALAVWYQGSARHWLRKRQARWAGVGLLVLLFAGHAVGTHRRNQVWHSEESLWLDVTIKSPRNGRGLMNYGLSQMAKGRFDRAEDYFGRAKALLPNYSYLEVNMAILKAARDQHREAEALFRRALALDPNNPISYFFYSRWLVGRGRLDEAGALVERLVQISPGYAGAGALAREIEARRSGQSMSIEDAEARARQDGNAAAFIDLSLHFYTTRDFEESIRLAREALALDPASFRALNNICAGYNSLGKWREAVEACERGLEINPGFELLRSNLEVARSLEMAEADDRY
ncbi:MAG: tetratricopeptide repeat protein [Thermoanaerobaculia bacterium]